jgi:hypothetical protein
LITVTAQTADEKTAVTAAMADGSLARAFAGLPVTVYYGTWYVGKVEGGEVAGLEIPADGRHRTGRPAPCRVAAT